MDHLEKSDDLLPGLSADELIREVISAGQANVNVAPVLKELQRAAARLDAHNRQDGNPTQHEKGVRRAKKIFFEGEEKMEEKPKCAYVYLEGETQYCEAPSVFVFESVFKVVIGTQYIPRKKRFGFKPVKEERGVKIAIDFEDQSMYLLYKGALFELFEMHPQIEWFYFDDPDLFVEVLGLDLNKKEDMDYVESLSKKKREEMMREEMEKSLDSIFTGAEIFQTDDSSVIITDGFQTEIAAVIPFD